MAKSPKWKFISKSAVFEFSTQVCLKGAAAGMPTETDIVGKPSNLLLLALFCILGTQETVGATVQQKWWGHASSRAVLVNHRNILCPRLDWISIGRHEAKGGKVTPSSIKLANFQQKLAEGWIIRIPLFCLSLYCLAQFLFTKKDNYSTPNFLSKTASALNLKQGYKIVAFLTTQMVLLENQSSNC